MQVIVATSIMPFVRGGANSLADWLVTALQQWGHTVDRIELPFDPDPTVILEQLLAFRLLDLSHRGDHLIAIRYPSYLLRHPFKTVWFIHHYREFYDLWDSHYYKPSATPELLRLKCAIWEADQVALGEARKLCCNSVVTAERLRRFNGLQAEVVYPPVLQPERYCCQGYGDFCLYLARLAPHKRQRLAIEALRYTQTPVRLVIAGQASPFEASYAAELRRLVEHYRLSDRVLLIDRWISEEEKIAVLAECLALVYFPFDEDSYGFASLEAHHAGKAVLTTSDSGGTRELVLDGVNGRVTSADPEAIAAAMDELYRNRELARKLGEAGRQRIRELGIHWDRALQVLLS